MISVFFEFLTRGLVWIFKSIFDLIAFFLRQLFRLFRLFLVILPITGIAYSFFFIALTTEIIAGDNVISSMLPIHFDSERIRTLIIETLRGYLGMLSEYSGTLMYFVLFMFLLLLAVPLSIIFVGAGTFSCAGKYLLIFVLADLFAFLVGSVISGKSPTQIIKGRYCRLFPKVGKKIHEKSYDKWLERHHEEFENDTFGKTKKRNRIEEFYAEDDDFDEDEDLYDEYYEDEEYDDDLAEYESEDDESDLYYEEDFEDDYEDDGEDDDMDDSQPQPLKGAAAAFNFFAGCNNLESANRKYKSLVKLYHPDNMDGDTSALQEINIQYNEIKKRLG